MERLIANILEDCKKDKKLLVKLKGLLVECQSYDIAAQLRDLLVKMFLENAGHDAPLLKLWYPPHQDGNGTVFIKND